jgi:hypothetical protein
VNATYCLALGGTFIENAVGTGFYDRLTGNALSNKISGGDGNDYLYGGDGDDNLIGGNRADWLHGEDGNDDLDAGSDLHADYYVFGADWGSDTITDGGGGADEVRGNTPSLADPLIGNLKVNLVSSDTSAEFTDGTNRVDWSGSVIDRAVTGPGNDEISQRPGGNDYMFARGGSDTYKGYDPSASVGFDVINDSVGDSAVDQLDLASFNLSNVSWSTQAGTTGNIRDLIISFDGGGRVTLATYFSNSSTGVCASGPGTGLIETIKFADDPSVDFAQVKRLLGCTPSDTTPPTVNSTNPVDNATGIASTAIVEAFFSEEMDQSTLTTSTFTLTKPDGPDADTNPDPVAGVVSYFPTIKKVLLDPSSDLEANTTYTATVKGGPGGAKDLAGNALSQDRTWTFTTAPPAPPTVVSYTPTQTSGVPRSIRLTATFSTNMDPSTVTASNIQFQVYNNTTSSWNSVAHNASYDSTSKMATVTPDSTLAASKKYRVTVTTNVKSSTGLALDQDASISGNQPKRWTFTTGTFIDSAVGNFSATQNPNGKWSFGYRASAGSGFVLYTSHANPWGPSFDQWSLYSSPTVTPHVTYNSMGQTASYSTITHPPNLLDLHPGSNGEKSVVCWTATSALTVVIKGRFEGIDTVGTTTDVAVVHNSATTLFRGNVNGYGAKAPFSITRSVAAGDTIEFYVGYGSNANHGFDSTGLLATITY